MLLPLDSKALIGGAHVARAFIQAYHLVYAQIALDLSISLASPDFARLLPDADLLQQGAQLPQLLWEFVGFEDALQNLLLGVEPAFTIEGVCREMPDGSVTYLDFQVMPIDSENPGAGLLLIVEDVTHSCELKQRVAQDRNELRLAQRALEEANQELDRLGRFKSFVISMAAHDMRSPLGVIMLYIDILRQELGASATPKLVYGLDMILSQVNWLRGLIYDLLSLEQAEQGRLLVNLETFNLNELVPNVLSGFQAMAAVDRIELNLYLPAEPVLLKADPERIKQVISNLLSNALKYSPEAGQVSLNLCQEAGYAVLDVSDTGRGMDANQIENLFRPYYRASEPERSRMMGIGLGLFIARTLVEMHHGTITVSSQPGHGTTFTVRLPLSQPSDGNPIR